MVNGEQKYIPGFLPQSVVKESDWMLILMNKKLLMKKEGDSYYIPVKAELKDIPVSDEALEYIGSYQGHSCFCTGLEDSLALPEDFDLIELRELTKLTGDPGLFLVAGNANHILHWRKMNRYCGCCGHKTVYKEDERAVVCPNCGNIIYPRIAPAIITAIFREDQILLAHNHNFREGLYSLIAGYVEPGEPLEQCVEREIFEEVGIRVKNVKYFSSQPWPFPDSLMMAFTAEYESGEITVDNCEILDAGWYQADRLPDIPSIDSVAGKIIRWYQDQKQKEK
jgi:NAD+ diphosphatase